MNDLTYMLADLFQVPMTERHSRGWRVPVKLRQRFWHSDDAILQQRGVPLVETEAADGVDADDADAVYTTLLELVERVLDDSDTSDPALRTKLERAARLLRSWLQRRSASAAGGVFE